MPQTQVLSGNAQSTSETPEARLDEALKRLADQQTPFARLGPGAKADLLESCLPRLVDVAERWVWAACEAKGIHPEAPTASEEWLGGPVTTIRNVRLLVESLREIERSGAPRFGRVVPRDDGRLEARVFPTSAMDSIMFGGFSGTHLFQEGVTESDARSRQASFYKKSDPEGGLSLILGAGNVSSIPPMDGLYKSFAEGMVSMIKVNPVNEWVGPFIEEAFRPLIDRGYWAVSYGGADTGRFLVEHDLVNDIHITGSDRTHDVIVWGPAGAERDRRKAENDPVLKKTITSELGNVTPVVIVPGAYSDAELMFVSRNVASMVTNNGSFNCNAAKMLVVSSAWKQRDRFLDLVRENLEATPPRKAYYPGAHDRYEQLVGDRDNVWRASNDREDGLRWAVVADVDGSRADEPLFVVEPFCGILSETALDHPDAEAFLDAAVSFCNDRLWGTLSMTIVVPRALERSPSFQSTLDRAIRDLRYGAVAINHWSGLAYGFVSTGWGGHPSATLQDIQSGLGWVHNTALHEGMDKTVIRGPLVMKPKPPWFQGHRTAHDLARKLVKLEAKGGWLRLPSIFASALRG